MGLANLDEFIQDFTQCSGSAVKFRERFLKDGEVDESLGVRSCDDSFLGLRLGARDDV